MSALDRLPLKTRTPIEWVRAVESDFDSFLLDHAACERKAFSTAMSLISKFHDKKAIIEPMICLAKEELQHYHEVYRLISKRDLNFGLIQKDIYIKKLLKHIRTPREEHFMDKLISLALIEARSCEKFELLGKELKDEKLRDFYARLAREEAGHYTIFIRLAKLYHEAEVVEKRLEEFLEIEAQIMAETPIGARMH